MPLILIIEDDHATARMMSMLIRQMGYEAVHAQSLAAGIEALASTPFDVVLLDVRLPDGSGLEVLPRIRNASSSAPEVIIMTGFGEKEGAELAIKNGAWDYLQKTDSPQKILLSLKRVIQYRESTKNISRQPVVLDLEGIVGGSPLFKECIQLLAQAAGSETNVLITGETGTGKELFARAIHRNSARAKQNFVVVDCGALPGTLVESILFGHTKGAYTGADQSCSGLVGTADNGTLFLDEIGELPLATQKAFLRVLQEKKFRPVGSNEECESNFRVIAATNSNLEQMARDGAFRKDLLYRLRTLSIHIPPLRERVTDIRPLTLYYIERLCQRRKIDIKSCDPDFLETLESHQWPGNVRELVHTLEASLSAGLFETTLFSAHLPDHLRIKIAQSHLNTEQPSATASDRAPHLFTRESPPSLKEIRKNAADKAERRYLSELITFIGNDIQAACKISGLSRSRFYELLKQHGLSLSNI